MRIEEMTTSDLRETALYHDTVLLTAGGIRTHKSHLPLGTSWFILRKIRDQIEKSLGGRILTFPLWPIDVHGEEEAMMTISNEALRDLFTSTKRQIADRLPLRYALLLCDSEAKEQAFLDAFSGSDILCDTFVWWRDGLQLDLSSYVLSGEQDTSILLSFAKGLIDWEEKSAQVPPVKTATSGVGESYLLRIYEQFQQKIERLWQQKY
nr:hypothetical protein [Bacilli bacterium]